MKPITFLQATLLTVFLTAITYLLVVSLRLNTLEHLLHYHWQFMDFSSLLESPSKSLLYLHSQPPLLNFIVWLLLLLPGTLYGNFLILNAFCVAIVSLIIFIISRHYLRSTLGALAITLLYMVTPATLLNAAYPFYPCLTTVGYALLVYSFFIAALKPRLSLFLFVFSLVYLGLLRISFTPLHVLFYCGVFYLYARDKIRAPRLLASFLLALCLSLAVPVKNYILYDFFGSSTWVPLNMAKGLAQKGTLEYFPSPQEIKDAYPELTCTHSYDVRDTALVKQDGMPNFNSCYIIEYGKIVKAKIWEQYSLKKHVLSIVASTARYFSPPDKYFMLQNRPAIEHYADLMQRVNLNLHIEKEFNQKTYEFNIEVLTLLLVLAAAIATLYSRDPFLYVCYLVFVCHFFSHVLTDGAEGARFVYDIEFLFFLFFAFIYNALKERRRRAG